MQSGLPLLCALLAAPLQAQEAARTEELFDGRTLAGWQGEEGFWSVQDGALTGESTPGHLAARTTYLVWTKSKVRDFELTLEFKLVGGNSGVQFRSRGAGPYDIAGYQADLEDGPSWTGCLYEQDGRGVVATRGQQVSYDEQGQRTSTTFGDPAEILAHVRAGEWNTYRIRAAGPRIDLEINGFPTVTVIDRDPAHAASEGCLALQLHQGMAMKAQFRKLHLVQLSAGARPEAQGPQWIWSTLPAKEDAEAWLGTRFELPAAARSVRISGCADNSFVAGLDGENVLAGDDWGQPVKVQLAHPLAAGVHRFEAHASNRDGPAGAWFEIVCELEDGSTLRFQSGDGWRASAAEPPQGWLDSDAAHAAALIGARGISPWGDLPAPVEQSATGSLAPDDVHVPPGFAVERLYSVPKALQGSWISLAFDPEGRIYASDQYGGLYRASFTPDRSAIASVERVPIALGEAHGLLWAFDALYAVVTNGGTYASGLYRARDTDGDDRLDQVELLSKFQELGGEHGPHSIVLGPDRRSLFVLAGNHTSLPSPLVSSRVPKLWDEDQLLPRCEDPGGHAVGVPAPGGWLARTDPDGKSWELVAAGMRNSYDFDFDEEGEPFTYDSDMEWDIGLPWYRPTRILHLASGADFGWRRGSGKFPAWVPDSLPAAVDVGLGSPTGVSFGYHSNFPSPWRERLFAGDWAYGRILAVELDPQGSSWSGSWQVFASGRPLPVTDLLFGPDGALYFAVGGRRTTSGLYRVRWTGARADERPPAIAGHEEREQRRALERFHAGEKPRPKELLAALESHDPFLRGAARAALEQLPPADWVGLLAEPRRPREAVELVLALVRAEARSSGQRVFQALDALPIERWNAEDRRDVLRIWQLALARAGAPPAELARRTRARLAQLLPASDLESQRVLLDLLVFLEEPSAVPFAMEAAAQEESAARALAYAWPLRSARAGWTPALRARFFQWLNRSQTLWAGGASFAGYLRHLRSEVLAGMDEQARRALGWLADEPVPPKLDGETVEVVMRWNESAITPLLPELRHSRSFENGKRAFARARCLECHRIANEGGNRGPDLTGAGARFSERDLLETVLRPSASIADQYGQTQIITRDERLLVGRVEREDERTLVLHVSAPAEESVTLDKEEISERAPSRLSAMPEGLLDVLDQDALLDLFAYVLAGAQPGAPAFH
jgi:putative heme-binding domain-containing protein